MPQGSDNERVPGRTPSPVRSEAHSSSGARRRDEASPRKWRRDEPLTRTEEWEVSEFYDSFDAPRP